jgi:alpha-L-fucosidase
LLGIGPKADGTLPAEAEKKMAEIGQWLQQNGKAIYNTRTAGEYKDGSVYFTQSKDGQTLYALACTNGDQVVPASVEWSGNVPAKGTKMKLLQDGTTVKWKAEGNKVKVFIPLSLQKKNMRLPALAFAYYAG